jgi:hypothetical protein
MAKVRELIDSFGLLDEDKSGITIGEQYARQIGPTESPNSKDSMI